MPLTSKDGLFTNGDILPGPNANLGSATNKWPTAYMTAANVGDVIFANGWRMTEDGENIVLKRPDGSVAHRWEMMAGSR